MCVCVCVCVTSSFFIQARQSKSFACFTKLWFSPRFNWRGSSIVGTSGQGNRGTAKKLYPQGSRSVKSSILFGNFRLISRRSSEASPCQGVAEEREQRQRSNWHFGVWGLDEGGGVDVMWYETGLWFMKYGRYESYGMWKMACKIWNGWWS